jgi:hypothetical protein
MLKLSEAETTIRYLLKENQQLKKELLIKRNQWGSGQRQSQDDISNPSQVSSIGNNNAFSLNDSTLSNSNNSYHGPADIFATTDGFVSTTRRNRKPNSNNSNNNGREMTAADRRRDRNREAAFRYRQKQNEKQAVLERFLQEAEQTKGKLELELSQLNTQLNEMKNILSRGIHEDCPVIKNATILP